MPTNLLPAMPNHDQQGHIDASKPTTQPALESSPAKSKKPEEVRVPKHGRRASFFGPKSTIWGLHDPKGSFEPIRCNITAVATS